MTQGVKDLIDAIASGDSIAIDAAFNSEMASRISERLDDMRIEVAQGMFRTEQIEESVELTEDQIVDEMINEVLTKGTPSGEWIHDFVHSDNPKFAGKSKEERKKMALAAYYAKQKNEEIDIPEMLDYLNENEEVLAELSNKTLVSYVRKGMGDREQRKDASRHFNQRADDMRKVSHEVGTNIGRGAAKDEIDAKRREYQDKADHHEYKAIKRTHGVDKALRKLSNR